MLCAPTAEGFIVPKMDKKEKKRAEIEEKEGKLQIQEWKGKEEGEWLSMAERRRESRIADEKYIGGVAEGRWRWRGKGLEEERPLGWKWTKN